MKPSFETGLTCPWSPQSVRFWSLWKCATTALSVASALAPQTLLKTAARHLDIIVPQPQKFRSGLRVACVLDRPEEDNLQDTAICAEGKRLIIGGGLFSQ